MGLAQGTNTEMTVAGLVTPLRDRVGIGCSDLTDKMKRSFFQAAVTSILLYGCTTCTLTKRLEKKLDGNYTRMLRAILNKSWQQHPTRHQLYGHLPPITKTIQVRRTRHAEHCWRSRDELISDVLLWTPTHGRAKARRPARTYIQQLCEDTGCNPEDLPGAMNDREEWRERVRDIRATSATWWWWWWYIYIYYGFRDSASVFFFYWLECEETYGERRTKNEANTWEETVPVPTALENEGLEIITAKVMKLRQVVFSPLKWTISQHGYSCCRWPPNRNIFWSEGAYVKIPDLKSSPNA